MPDPNLLDPTKILEFLVRCLRPGADLSFLAELGPEDWHALLRQVSRHSLGPLLFQRLVRQRARQPLALPPKTEELLRLSYYQTLHKNMLAYNLLGQVLNSLQAEGGRVLLLKGAYLAEQVYGDIGLRPMTDLDLLVPAEQLQRSLALLNEMGFIARRPYSEEADGALHFHAPALIKDDVVIELHWDLVLQSSPVQIDLPDLWARATPFTLADTIAQNQSLAWTLAPEDLVLYLCVHAVYLHEFSDQLRSLVDIAEVIQHFDAVLDWEMLVVTAGRWKARRGVYVCLTLVVELLGAKIPAEGLAALQPVDWTPQVLAWARQMLFQEEVQQSSNFLIFMSKDLPLGQRFQALLGGFFPPRAIMTRLYGFPPGSWQITVRYLPYAAGRIRLYWVRFLRRVRGDSRQEELAQSTLALQDWLRE